MASPFSAWTISPSFSSHTLSVKDSVVGMHTVVLVSYSGDDAPGSWYVLLLIRALVVLGECPSLLCFWATFTSPWSLVSR